jgi:transcriptional regulator with XRE-family HTH domain
MVKLEPYHPLRELRLDAGLTQAELADRVGLTQASISRIESGAPLYRACSARLCAEAFCVELADVLAPAQRALYNRIADAGLADLWVGAHEERKLALRELLHAEGVRR